MAVLPSGLLPRFRGSLFCDLSSPTVPPNSEVKDSPKTLPLGLLVSLETVDRSVSAWTRYCGITGKKRRTPLRVGRVGVESPRVGLECGPLGGLAAKLPVTQTPHGRGLLL